MGGLTSAVQWWEESQMRVLVLSSMAIQVHLFIFFSLRRFAIPRWVRSIMWLAYLAGDAVAIYALATLFNRHKDQAAGQGGGGGSSSVAVSTLEVMWAPVLLLHLGGQDNFTAYNIEDNELWSRHLVTAVSQVTVAIYVFCKSWPPGGGEKRLLQAAILMFIPGVVKCFVKAWALKNASIYNLVSSSAATASQNEDQDMYPLQEYVEQAKEFVDHDQEQDNENAVDDVATPVAASVEDDGGHSPSQAGFRCFSIIFRRHHEFGQRIRERLRELGKLVDDDEGTCTQPPSGEEEDKQDKHYSLSQQQQGRQGCFCAQYIQQLYHESVQVYHEFVQVKKRLRVLGEASDKLFVDLSSPYPIRLRILKYFWGISQDRAYRYAQGGLLSAFLLLYTKLKTAGFFTEAEIASELGFCDRLKIRCCQCILIARAVLPLVSIGLFFHWSRSRSHSHSKQAHDGGIIDVKITYAIFYCTAVLEIFSSFPIFFGYMAGSDDISAIQKRMAKWPEMVAQCSLMGYFASNKKHSNWMCIAGIFGCKDFVNQRILCMKPCSSSARISRLVLGYLKHGWKKEIHDAPSYRRFNDHSTHWPMHLHHDRNGYCSRYAKVPSMRKRHFDESVLLWHIATDICFFSSPTVSEHRCEVQTSWKTSLLDFIRTPRTMSNEQRHQCRLELTPCRAVQCRQMSNYMVYLLFVNPEMLLPGTRRNLFTEAYDGLNDILKDMDMGSRKWDKKVDEWVIKIVIKTMQQNRSKQASKPCSEEEPKKVSSSKEISNKKGGRSKTKLIDDAWALAQRLLDKGDEKKMWEEIQHVWVEMLCFSASRCRGYLHAKALGEGGEFLSYIWLTLFHMGMETFTDKLQMEEPLIVSHEAGNNVSATPVPLTTPPSTSEISTNIAAPSTSSEICMAEDDMV